MPACPRRMNPGDVVTASLARSIPAKRSASPGWTTLPPVEHYHTPARQLMRASGQELAP